MLGRATRQDVRGPGSHGAQAAPKSSQTRRAPCLASKDIARFAMLFIDEGAFDQGAPLHAQENNTPKLRFAQSPPDAATPDIRAIASQLIDWPYGRTHAHSALLRKDHPDTLPLR